MITIPQIGVFVYHVLILTNQGKDVGPNGPAYTKVQTLPWFMQSGLQGHYFLFGKSRKSIQKSCWYISAIVKLEINMVIMI